MCQLLHSLSNKQIIEKPECVYCFCKHMRDYYIALLFLLLMLFLIVSTIRITSTMLLLLLLLLLFCCCYHLLHGIYKYVPETGHVSKVYSVAAIL